MTPGHALEVCVRRKLSANLQACRATAMEFILVVVETVGGWALGASSTIRRIGEAIGQRVNPSCLPHTTRHFFGRLGVALWCGHTTLWLLQTPPLPPQTDGII